MERTSWRLSLKLSTGTETITGAAVAAVAGATDATVAAAAAATEEASATTGIGWRISSNLNMVLINSAARKHVSTKKGLSIFVYVVITLSLS